MLTSLLEKGPQGGCDDGICIHPLACILSTVLPLIKVIEAYEDTHKQFHNQPIKQNQQDFQMLNMGNEEGTLQTNGEAATAGTIYLNQDEFEIVTVSYVLYTTLRGGPVIWAWDFYVGSQVRNPLPAKASAFWVELVAPDLPSAGYLSYVICELLNRSGVFTLCAPKE
ncbi:hypothetical protein H5410_047699 [Solanum commersonii]|uniref:Uncharacterized protein n=1 Tax=Solanum commersonii TaxID=4109 RepID=A0A9J5XFV6_SOLCO|nr:hypothetical protein H5410_047699 [Solanum commersonii]